MCLNFVPFRTDPLNGRAPVSSSLMMERRGEGGVGEPTQLCKDLITAQVSTTWTRSSGMKRCCDMRLPFKRKRQQSFATSSSQEEKVAPVLLRNRSFSQRLENGCSRTGISDPRR